MRNSRRNTRTFKQRKNKFRREKLAGAKMLQKAHLEIGVAHHDAAVALKAGRRQALSQSVSDHKVRTQRYQLNQISQSQFTDVVSTNIDMTRILSADGVDRHSDTREVVFINKSWLSLCNVKIVENSTYVDNFLSVKACGHIFSF